MSRICKVCGKRPSSGHSVSHSNRKTKRLWRPNLQRLRIVLEGTRTRAYVCTACISAGKITRPQRRQSISQPSP